MLAPVIAGIKAAVAGAFNLLLVPGDRRWFWTGSTAGRAKHHMHVFYFSKRNRRHAHMECLLPKPESRLRLPERSICSLYLAIGAGSGRALLQVEPNPIYIIV